MINISEQQSMLIAELRKRVAELEAERDEVVDGNVMAVAFRDLYRAMQPAPDDVPITAEALEREGWALSGGPLFYRFLEIGTLYQKEHLWLNFINETVGGSRHSWLRVRLGLHHYARPRAVGRAVHASEGGRKRWQR